MSNQGAAQAPVADAAQLNELLRDGPSVPQLVAILAVPHVQLREQLGDHHLHYVADFSLEPTTPLGRPPREGEHIETSLKVRDEMDLVWSAPDEQGPRFSLVQHNDQADRRALIVVAGRAYTRLHEDTWYARELDGELHELWLEDASAAVHDIVEFAAPRLKLSAAEPVQVGGRDAYAFQLSSAPTSNEKMGRPGAASRWRAAADLAGVQGEVVVDAATGAALKASVAVSFSMRDAAGRPLKGVANLDAELLIAPQSPTAPPKSAPLPERHRYELERKKLLDGLAAL